MLIRTVDRQVIVAVFLLVTNPLGMRSEAVNITITSRSLVVELLLLLRTPLLQVITIVIVFWCLQPAIIGSCFYKLIFNTKTPTNGPTDPGKE